MAETAADSGDAKQQQAEVLKFSGVELRNRKQRLLKGDTVEFSILTTRYTSRQHNLRLGVVVILMLWLLGGVSVRALVAP